jgi:hypothetical protein
MSNGSDRTLELIHTLEHPAAVRAYILVLVARRAGIPLTVISGRRSTQANQDVGGAEKSYHLTGNAFDVEVHGYPLREQIPFEWWQHLGEWAEQNLELYWGGRHFHAGRRDVNHFDLRRLLTSV